MPVQHATELASSVRQGGNVLHKSYKNRISKKKKASDLACRRVEEFYRLPHICLFGRLVARSVEVCGTPREDAQNCGNRHLESKQLQQRRLVSGKVRGLKALILDCKMYICGISCNSEYRCPTTRLLFPPQCSFSTSIYLKGRDLRSDNYHKVNTKVDFATHKQAFKRTFDLRQGKTENLIFSIQNSIGIHSILKKQLYKNAVSVTHSALFLISAELVPLLFYNIPAKRLM